MVDGGVGYRIRRLMAERAKTAREAVDVAIGLVTKYGYTSGGRTYTVADRNEAWQIMLLKGHRYIARKVQDDEVTYIAIAFSLDKIDVDAKDVIMSPDLIDHAVKTGKYKPAKAGDASDFSFASYQPVSRRAADWNKDRAQTAWKMLMGKSGKTRKPSRTLDQARKEVGRRPDVRAILSGHWKREERTSGLLPSVDAGHLQRGDVRVGRLRNGGSAPHARLEDFRAVPARRPYVPFFPLAKPAEAQAFMAPDVATAEHFHASPDRFDYKADFSLYAFLDAEPRRLPGRRREEKDLRAAIDAQQQKWVSEGRRGPEDRAYLKEDSFAPQRPKRICISTAPTRTTRR